jgi:osmoprotectant transport system permease protein
MLDWAWMADHLDTLADKTGQHLVLTVIALVIGFAISFAIGVAASRWTSLYPPAAVLAGVIFTIPSLAMFSALVPITGFSTVTAEIPLVLYTLVILIRNIVAGFRAVPADVVEAADGMGFGRSRRLLRVELPLAIPLIVAGLRVASVSTIGLVVISGTLGVSFGGLGFFIFEGIQRGFPTEIYFGAVPTILLALAADRFFVLVEALATPWARGARRAAGGT